MDRRKFTCKVKLSKEKRKRAENKQNNDGEHRRMQRLILPPLFFFLYRHPSLSLFLSPIDSKFKTNVFSEKYHLPPPPALFLPDILS